MDSHFLPAYLGPNNRVDVTGSHTLEADGASPTNKSAWRGRSTIVPRWAAAPLSKEKEKNLT